MFTLTPMQVEAYCQTWHLRNRNLTPQQIEMKLKMKASYSDLYEMARDLYKIEQLGTEEPT